MDLFDKGIQPSNIAKQLDVSDSFVTQKLRTARRISGNDGNENVNSKRSGGGGAAKKAKTSGASLTKDKADTVPDGAEMKQMTSMRKSEGETEGQRTDADRKCFGSTDIEAKATTVGGIGTAGAIRSRKADLWSPIEPTLETT